MMWNLKLAAAIGILFTTSLAGTAWYAYSSGKQSGMSSIQSRWDTEVAAMAQAQAEEIMKARQREQALEALIKRQREEHRREANRIAREFAALSDSLRDRPEARAGDGGVPEGADAGTTGCTGAGLSRRDAEFLAGLATDAERAQSALRACIAHTAEIERQLNR